MRYLLRPETIESLFILHSVNPNAQYRAWAWSIFEAIQKHCTTKVALSGIVDVSRVPAQHNDKMQSYVFAETFKYLFLLFDDAAARKVPLDEFVFNTEGHPVRIVPDMKERTWFKASQHEL